MYVCNFGGKGRNLTLQGNVIDVTFVLQSSFFCLDTKEKEPKRKNQGCVFPATPVLPPAKGQKLATLKQSALLNASLRALA